MGYLNVKNLEKSFTSEKILKGISFSLEKGKVVSIIGSSGSGKTTLLRCVNFLERADAGEITLEGEMLFNGSQKEKDLTVKRLNFGLVFQSFNLFPHFTVEKNVKLSPYYKFRDECKKRKFNSVAEKREFISAGKAAIDAECDALLSKVGLKEKAKAYPCELSGGQQQRVAIARALALKPKILCFDEPTSALDPELTGEVLKVIKALKEEGRTMIIVTHEMEFARNVSDKILFMANGVIEEEGTPDEVFNNPRSEKLKNFLSKSSENF